MKTPPVRRAYTNRIAALLKAAKLRNRTHRHYRRSGAHRIAVGQAPSKEQSITTQDHQVHPEESGLNADHLKRLLDERKTKEAAEYIGAHDSDFRRYCGEYDGRAPDYSGINWVHCIAWLDWTEVLFKKLTTGHISDLWAVDVWHQTATHYAAARGNLNMIHFLSNIGAPMNSTDEFGHTPLMDASMEAKVQVVDFLWKHCVVPLPSGAQAFKYFQRATRQGNVNMVKEFIRIGLDVNTSLDATQVPSTPLGWAACLGRIETAKILLQHGADPNVTDPKDGRSVLHHACDSDNPAMVDLILENYVGSLSTKLERKDDHGCTPLDYAFQTGKHKAASHMISLGANAWTRDVSNRTILHTAAGWSPLPSLIDLALAQGIPIDSRADNDATSLHWAVEMTKKENIDLLLQRGASLFASDGARRTPLDACLGVPKGSTVVTSLLRVNPIVPFSFLGTTQGTDHVYTDVLEQLLVHLAQHEWWSTYTLSHIAEALDILLGSGASPCHILEEPLNYVKRKRPDAEPLIRRFVQTYPLFFAKKQLILCWRQRVHIKPLPVRARGEMCFIQPTFKHIATLPLPLQEKILSLASRGRHEAERSRIKTE